MHVDLCTDVRMYCCEHIHCFNCACLQDPRRGGRFLCGQFLAPLVERHVLQADCNTSGFRVACRVMEVRSRSLWKAAPAFGKAPLMQSKAFGAPT